MDFPEPITVLDYYLAELDWRFDGLHELIYQIYDDLADIREILEYTPSPEYDPSPRPPYEFDPLQRIQN
jgi:hypothetical protein